MCFSFYEVSHAQRECAAASVRRTLTFADAFIRDELSKGRYDPAIAGICFQMLLEVFGRTLRSDLGPPASAAEPETAC